MATPVGVLGSGDVGRTLAQGFARHGHKVMLGTRRPGDESIQKWLRSTPGASVGTFAQAAKFGQILVLAVLGRAVEEVILQAGAESFSGKTVIDTTNPITDHPPIDGVLQFTTGRNESLGEEIQSLLPEAHVVKAFNSVGAAKMVNPRYEQGPPTMFICGDDASAKATVTEVLTRFGWETCDCGSIIACRAIEPLCILWCIPGFRNNQWNHAFKLLQR